MEGTGDWELGTRQLLPNLQSPILNQAAWRALKKDPALKAFFERLYPKTGKKRAIVAVARQLIGRLRATFKTGKPYQINPLSLQPA